LYLTGLPDRPTESYEILVVDDDATILHAVSEALRMWGHRVTTARNGSEGLAAAEAVDPDLVLLDLRMPVLDGWEFARLARERCLVHKIVVMTAGIDAERQAELVGADGVLPKPFGVDQLIEMVSRLCRKAA